MSSRQASSRVQGSARRTHQASRRPRIKRSDTAILVFFLGVFLVLLMVLLLTRLTPGQLWLLALVICLLCTALCGARVLRRNSSRRTGSWSRSTLTRGVSAAPEALAPLFAEMVTISDLLRLSPGEFEDFVGDLLAATGQWSDVRRVGGAGDHGADLLARDRFGRPFIVQCKRYHPGHKVGAGEIRNFLGARAIFQSDECLFVTTSSFTEAARDNARPFQHTVFLWDGEKLLQIVQECWEKLPARWKA